jgi:hypothetical protein
MTVISYRGSGALVVDGGSSQAADGVDHDVLVSAVDDEGVEAVDPPFVDTKGASEYVRATTLEEKYSALVVN